MNQCPEPDPSYAPSHFLASRCRRDRGALALDMTCRVIWTVDRQLVDGEEHESDFDEEGNWINNGTRMDDGREYEVHMYPENKVYELSCNENEICVDHRSSPEPSPDVDDAGLATASCVSTETFRAIAANRIVHLQEDATQVAKEAAVAPPAKKQAVEVVITHPDHSSSMWAKRMRVQAQGFKKMYNTEVWRTLANGATSCKRCSSLTLDPVPDGAMRYDVDILLSAPDLNVSGFMYLFDIS